MLSTNHHTKFLATTLALALASGTAHAAPPTIFNLGLLSGGTYSRGGQVSENGMVVAGTADLNTDEQWGDRAFRWTISGGMQNLGVPSGLNWTAGNSISADGTTVAGNGTNRFFRWTSSTGPQNLGLLPGGTLALATGVSGNGSVVVGWGNHAGSFYGGRWTSSTGIQSLGALPSGIDSGAYGISKDGTIIVGSSSWAGTGARACMWVGSSAPVNLGVLFGGLSSWARAVSANNLVIAGDSDWVGDESLGVRMFRWTNAGGMQNLGVPPGATDSYANAINADGKMIVGRAKFGATYRAVIWTAQTGIVDLKPYLVSHGLDLSQWTLSEANGVSADGSTISGTGLFNGNQRAFIIRRVPCPSKPVITLEPLSQPTIEHTTIPVTLSTAADVPLDATYQWFVESDSAIGGWYPIGSSPYLEPFTFLTFDVAGWNTPNLDVSNIDLGTEDPHIRFRADITNNCGTVSTQIVTISILPPVCAADYNGDTTGADIADFLDFFDDFGNCQGQDGPCGSYGNADFNADTIVDVLDFLDFFEAFGAGC